MNRTRLEVTVGLTAFLCFVAMALTGCGFLYRVLAGAGAAVTPEKPACVVRYVRVSPYEHVGFDNCGHLWKLILPRPAVDSGTIDSMGHVAADSVECWIYVRDSGLYQQIDCPALGDTLITDGQ